MLEFILATLVLSFISFLYIVFEVEHEMYFFKKQLVQEKNIIKKSEEYKLMVKSERSELYSKKSKSFGIAMIIILLMGFSALLHYATIAIGVQIIK